MSKTIAIIGGMGPQASIFAQSQLQKSLIRQGKQANIVHISLNIEPFFDRKPRMLLTNSQKALLQEVDADVGFIACNTAHYFFDLFQSMVNFRLESLLENANLPEDHKILCSPTSTQLKVFGGHKGYPDSELSKKLGNIIENVNSEKSNVTLSELIHRNSKFVFGCTELSMLAQAENLDGYDTLQVTIEKIVKEL